VARRTCPLLARPRMAAIKGGALLDQQRDRLCRAAASSEDRSRDAVRKLVQFQVGEVDAARL